VDFVLTDPPYINRYTTRDGRAIRNDNFQWIKPAFAELYRVLKRDSFCAFFYGWAHIHKFAAAFTEAGFRPIGHLIFPKPYTSGARFLRYQHECAYLLAKGEPKQPEYPIADVIQWTHYTGNKLHPGTRAYLYCKARRERLGLSAFSAEFALQEPSSRPCARRTVCASTLVSLPRDPTEKPDRVCLSGFWKLRRLLVAAK
jgi:hypothetical protein